MRCTSCGYALWNLPGRMCPECGQPFRPSGFSFNANTVRFLCPHCRQDYYGTDENGHLVPRSFACVRCAAAIDMDGMILLPIAGVEEALTRGRRPDPNPWLRRRELGASRAGWRTLGRTLASPGSLMDAPAGATGRIRSALVFALIIATVTTLLAVGPFAVIMVYSASITSAMTAAAIFAGLILGLVAYLLVASLIAHGFLAISGGTPGGLARSIEAGFYAGGPLVTAGIPCMFLQVIAGSAVWCGISHGLMLRRAHGISTPRAIIAGLITPLLAIAAAAALIITTVLWSMNTVTGAISGMQPLILASSAGSTLGMRALAQGAWPAHGLELVNAGSLERQTVIDPGALPMGAALPGVDAFSFHTLNPPKLAALTTAAAAALPADVIAHRLGDLVFTYHGLPADGSARASAWIVAWAEHPGTALLPGSRRATAASAGTPIAAVSTVDGALLSFMTKAEFDAALLAENSARAADGLAPLPDLLDFDWVATQSAPGSQPLPDFAP